MDLAMSKTLVIPQSCAWHVLHVCLVRWRRREEGVHYLLLGGERGVHTRGVIAGLRALTGVRELVAGFLLRGHAPHGQEWGLAEAIAWDRWTKDAIIGKSQLLRTLGSLGGLGGR